MARPPLPPGTTGEISFTTLPSGKIQASARLRTFTGQVKRVKASGKTKTIARRELQARAAVLAGVDSTSTLGPYSTTRALIESYLWQLDPGKSTSDRYKTAARLHVLPALGELKIIEVTPAVIDRWQRGLTPGAVGNARSVLGGALSMAVRYGVLRANPMRELPAPLKQRAAHDTPRALTRGDIPAFRAHIAARGDQQLSRAIDVALSTGLRAGELLALRWADVDIPGGTITVTGTISYSRRRGNHRQETTKTSAGLRTIAAPALALEALAAQWDYLTTLGGAPTELAPVFPAANGNWLSESNFNKRLRKARAGGWEWVTIHTLRRTVATLVTEALGPRAAAEVLGHSDSRLTETTYVVATTAQGAARALTDLERGHIQAVEAPRGYRYRV